jgi:ABC-type nitrate/sulfonate/bicarbonate transport system substrate-binding protein
MTDLNIFLLWMSMIKINPLSMIVGGLTFLVTTLTPATRIIAYALDTFYNGGAGATGVRELPLFVAKDFKIFDKYGLDVELISTDREKAPDRFATHASAHGSVN